MTYLATRLTEDIYANIFADHTKLRLSTTARHKLLDDKLRVTLDAPGVDLEQISIDVEGRYLTIRATRDGQESRCAYTIAEGFDLSQATATLKNGVLTIDIPRLASAIKRKITVMNG